MEPYVAHRKADRRHLTIEKLASITASSNELPLVAWVGSVDDELQWCMSRVQRIAAVHRFDDWQEFTSKTQASPLRFNRLLIAPTWRDPSLLNQLEQWQATEPLIPIALLLNSRLEGTRRTWLPLTGPMAQTEFFYWYQTKDRLTHWIAPSTTSGRFNRRPPGSMESRTDRWFFTDLERPPSDTQVILIGSNDSLRTGWSEACSDQGIAVKVLEERQSHELSLLEEVTDHVSSLGNITYRIWFYRSPDLSDTLTPVSISKMIVVLRSQSSHVRFGLIDRRVDWVSWQQWLAVGIEDLLVPPFRIDGLWL